MIRRKGDKHRHSRSAGIDELVTQLEDGSSGARDRLGALVRSSYAAPPADTGVAAQVLDRVALSAAAGSDHSLDLLLALIVEFELVAPAVQRLVSNRPLIEDIEQDVLFAVSHSIHGFRGESKFTTWLYSLARNVTIGHLRTTRPDTTLTADDLLDDGSPRRMSSQIAQRHVVRQAIESLPPRFRQTVFLRDIEGLSYSEIAQREGLELNTVRSRLSRGRAMLASRLS